MSHLKIIWTPDPTKKNPDPQPEVVLDHDVYGANIRSNVDWREIRSNPRLAAAMAGAPPEVLAKLPGDQVAYIHHGTDVEVTYTIRYRIPGGQITDSHPAI